jgi:hypothetical protein
VIAIWKRAWSLREEHLRFIKRALRATEPDVINEEMYEEEDDRLSTQYQRLGTYLHTASLTFNKRPQVSPISE